MTEEQLHQGIALAKAGKKLEARNVLSQVVKEDPYSVMGWLWLAGVVETKEQQRYCLETVLQLNPQNTVVQHVLAQLEMAQPRVAAGSKYFIGHQLTTRSADSLRRTIANVFGPMGYEPCYTDVNASTGTGEQSTLFRTCQKAFLSSFGMFDLSSATPGDCLELGIALGLNRPIIAIANEKVGLPLALDKRCVTTYTDYADLEIKLSRICGQSFPPTARPAPDYCYFCGQICESMSTPLEENFYLVLNESRMLWRSLMQTLAPHLAKYDLQPVYLTDQTAGPVLCDMRKKVLASRFALGHLGALSNHNSFLALGMAIGSRAPWILLSQQGQTPAPAILQGFECIEYATLTDLEERLTDALSAFLGRVIPGSVTRNGKTTALALPFWIQFEDWINRVKHAARGTEEIQGKVRIIQYEGQERLLESRIPTKGLLVGRATDCDVVIKNQGVSSHHFRMLSGRNDKCFVEDLHSKNGTFLNGTRLSPGIRAEVRPTDVIRIPSVRFLVWDERPLPAEKLAPILGDTDLLPPILKVEIPDVSPPAYLDTWDHSLVLTVSLPDGRTRSMFEVQAYYPMKCILAKLVDLLGLPKRKYCFMMEDKLIGDDETPLSVGIQKKDVLVMVAQEAC